MAAADNNGVRSLPLRTYTSLWQLERKLYKWWDWKLPVPVSARMLLVLLGTAVPWMLLLAVIHFPFNLTFWHMLWWGPPVIVTVLSGRPLAEGKTLIQLVSSRIKYWTRPHHYNRMRPQNPPAHKHFYAWTWTPRARIGER